MKFALAVSPVFATVAVIETLNVEGVYITSGAWTDIVPDVFVSSDSDVTMNSLLSELAETSISPPQGYCLGHTGFPQSLPAGWKCLQMEL